MKLNSKMTQETQTSVAWISAMQRIGKPRFHARGKMQFRIKAILVAAIGVLAMLAACSNDDDNPMSGDPPSGNRPSISGVSWTQDSACVQFTPSNVTISVTVNDPDNAVNELTFFGSVSRCSGTISGAVSEISCPQAGQYSGTVTVTDPDGNTDSINFAFGPCDNGMVTK